MANGLKFGLFSITYFFFYFVLKVIDYQSIVNSFNMLVPLVSYSSQKFLNNGTHYPLHGLVRPRLKLPYICKFLFIIPYRKRASLRASERYGIKNE